MGSDRFYGISYRHLAVLGYLTWSFGVLMDFLIAMDDVEPLLRAP